MPAALTVGCGDQIVPGSHTRVKEIERRRRAFERELFKDSPGHRTRMRIMSEFHRLSEEERSERRSELFGRLRALPEQFPEMVAFDEVAQQTRKQFFEPFTKIGLTPSIVDAKAGDLIIFVSESALLTILLPDSCLHKLPFVLM